MKKKNFFSFCVAAAVCCLGTGSVTAAISCTLTGSGDNLTLTITGTGAMPAYSAGNAPWYSSHASIRTVVINSGVTSIGSQAFWNCRGLTSVTIPNSVTSIGGSAFYNCSGLISVTIPDNVTHIGSDAFYGCSTLTTVNFNATNCTTMGTMGNQNPVFNNCPALRTVNIGNNVTSIPHRAFYDCSYLTSVTIPNSVTSIGQYAFYGCSGLTSVTIPDGVTSIGQYAFYGCSGLTSVTIGNNVTSIEEAIFFGCSGLTSVTIGNNVTSIGRAAFSGCSGLTSVTIPDGVTSIGGSAFYNCSGLTSVTIPNSMTSIGIQAFYGCSGLTSVTIPNSMTSIGMQAFYGCRTLTTVNFNATNCTTMGSDSNPAFRDCPLSTVIIGNNVTKIPDFAFSGCSGLTSVTIGSGVTSIGYRAFFGCRTLATVNFNATNCTTMGSASYPAFRDCPLSTVNIGNNVTKIPDFAFSDCSGLTSITIPGGVTSIGSSAFSNCSGLTSVIIPISVTSIGEGAFYRCSGLTSITISNRVTSIESSTFAYCFGLTSVTLPVNVTSIGSSAFAYCSGLTAITIPSSVTSIGSDAFVLTRLPSIICLSTTPPLLGNNSFFDFAVRDALYVPAGSLNAYRSNSNWNSQFSAILAYAPATGVSLNKTTATLAFGSTEQFTATVAPTNAAPNSVAWRSSNTAVATVSNSGLVTAEALGVTTITVTAQNGGYTATCTVNVVKPAGTFVATSAVNTTYTAGLTLAGITLPANYAWQTPTATATVNAGNGQTFTAIYTDPSGNYNGATGNVTVNVAKATGTFASTSAKSATYTAGLTLANITLPANYVWQTPDTAVNAGNGQTFTAIYTDPSGNYEAATGNVTVNVAKATPSVTYPTQATVQSGAALATAVFTGGSSSVSGAFAFSSASTIPALSNSNSTNYELVFTPTDIANYNTTTKPDMKVTVVPSSDATLSSLAVTGYSISPAFDANTTVYTLIVPNGVNSITIEAAATDSERRSVTGTGSKFIAVGENPFTITVTAEDGATTKEYLLIVTRQEASAVLSSNANLSTLSVSGYAISPAFDANLLDYTLTVPNAVTHITINATQADNAAQGVSGAGAKTLSVGSNPFSIVVTAEDGTTKIYTLTVTRQEEEDVVLSSNANLSTLSVSGYTISPAFDVNTASYTLTVPNSTSSITINATKADSKASVAGVGIKPIDVGSNEFAVVVTAEDGTQKLYTITITREAENSATAVATQTVTSLQIYPNPARDRITIVSDEWNVGDKVKIYNPAGALVGATQVSPLQDNTITIDIAHLPAGIYIVKVGNKSAKVVKK